MPPVTISWVICSDTLPLGAAREPIVSSAKAKERIRVFAGTNLQPAGCLDLRGRIPQCGIVCYRQSPKCGQVDGKLTAGLLVPNRPDRP